MEETWTKIASVESKILIKVHISQRRLPEEQQSRISMIAILSKIPYVNNRTRGIVLGDGKQLYPWWHETRVLQVPLHHGKPDLTNRLQHQWQHCFQALSYSCVTAVQSVGLHVWLSNRTKQWGSFMETTFCIVLLDFLEVWTLFSQVTHQMIRHLHWLVSLLTHMTFTSWNRK